MTRFAKIYGKISLLINSNIKTNHVNSMNREGYGYIKRRVGLLSNELSSPTYLALSELSKFLKEENTKSSQ